MTITIDQAYINAYRDTMYSLLEQNVSRLRPAARIEMAKGEKHFFDRLGTFTASEVVGRLSETVLQDPAHSRRMATVRRYHASTYLDDIDALKMMIDPTNEYTTKLARAHGRNLDDIIIDALLGTASTGKDGSGSQALTAGQKIEDGGASTAMTVSKFNQALRILEANEVDLDSTRIYLAVGANGIEDLLGDSSNQFTSFDFQDGKVLSSGRLPQFRGVNIIRTQRIPDNGSDKRAILFTEDAVKVAMARDLEVKAAERADLNFALQLSTYMFFGAVRMEEENVVEINYTA